MNNPKPNKLIRIQGLTESEAQQLIDYGFELRFLCKMFDKTKSLYEIYVKGE